LAEEFRLVGGPRKRRRIQTFSQKLLQDRAQSCAENHFQKQVAAVGSSQIFERQITTIPGKRVMQLKTPAERQS